MTRIKKIIAVVTIITVLLGLSGLHTFAATVTQDNLEASLVTDKAEYLANEQIKTTLTVKNNNETAVANVDLETALPDGYSLADNTENKKTVDSIATGESVSLEVTLIKKSTPGEPSTDPKSTTNPVSGGNSGGSGKTTGGTTSGGTTTSGSAVQTGQSGLLFASCLVVMLAALAAIWFFRTHEGIKNRNNIKKFISLVLCASFLTGTMLSTGLPVFAEETTVSKESISISEEIEVGETKLTISANVVYDKEEKTIDDNITKVSDDMYITNPQAEHVRYDEEAGIPYIDNVILVTFKQGIDESVIEAFVSEIGGTIIGKIAPTNTYQIQISVCETFADIESIISQIEANVIVDFASADILMIEKANAYYPFSDTKWKDEWSTFPKDSNWGVEAIKAPEAWEYMDYMQDVNVGIIDTMFLNHSDLHFEDILVNTNNATKKHMAHTLQEP